MTRVLVVFLLLLSAPPALEAALSVSASTGSSFNVPHYYTGHGLGFQMGEFLVTNPAATGLVMRSITTTAIGSGNDSTGFTEIGLFVDFNNSGYFEPGIDQRYGQSLFCVPCGQRKSDFFGDACFCPRRNQEISDCGQVRERISTRLQQRFSHNH